MKANKNTEKVPQHYRPVKPFAFEAWKIWNHLTTSAELLWGEYENDFVHFCCESTHTKGKKHGLSNHVPF